MSRLAFQAAEARELCRRSLFLFRNSDVVAGLGT